MASGGSKDHRPCYCLPAAAQTSSTWSSSGVWIMKTSMTPGCSADPGNQLDSNSSLNHGNLPSRLHDQASHRISWWLLKGRVMLGSPFGSRTCVSSRFLHTILPAPFSGNNTLPKRGSCTPIPITASALSLVLPFSALLTPLHLAFFPAFSH